MVFCFYLSVCCVFGSGYLLKKIKINKSAFDFHPCVREVIEGDIINNKLPYDIDKISETNLAVLLENIVLNVILSDDGGYLLLTPNRVYDFLIQHPASPKLHVNLLIHSPENESELFKLIDTLNLVQPALQLLESANKSQIINARYLKLNEMTHKATSLTLLAKLANKTKSAFRK